MVSGELSHERTSRETEKPCLFYPHTKKKNQKRDNFDVSKLHIAVLSAFSVYTTISKSALYGIQINTEQQKYHQFTIQPWSSRTSNLQLYWECFCFDNQLMLLNTKSHSHYYQFHWFKTCFTWAHVKALLQLPKFEHHIDYHWPYGSTYRYVYSRLGKSFSNLNSTGFFYLTFRQISNGWLQTDTNTEL